jgi:hypothetical protein
VKNIEYTCDVCGDVIHRERLGLDLRPFVSYALNIMADHAIPQNRFAVRQPFEVVRHVCHLCLAGLVALASECLSAEVMAKATGGRIPAPAVTEPLASAGVYCCLCGGSLTGVGTISVPVGSIGNAHMSCVETATAAAAGAHDARTYAARVAEARVHAVRETTP